MTLNERISYMAFYAVSTVLLVALIAGCSTTSGSPAQDVYAAKTSLVAATQLATQYANLPRCIHGGSPICSDQSKVDTIDHAAHAAADAVQAAENTVRDPAFSGDTQSKAVTAATNAVTALQAIVADVTKPRQ